jgi:phospholipid/cholesterol/gamma-HCH transport system substrate-binding protein
MSRRLLTWLFMIVALGLALAALRYSSWVHFTRGTHAFLVQVRDVGGLREGTEIYMAGFQVGEVSEIRVISTPTLHFDLELQVRRDIPILEGTIAVMVSRGFGGIRVLELRPPVDAGQQAMEPGSRLQALSEPELGDVILRADQAFRQLGEVAADLKAFTSAEVPQPGLRQTVARFESTLQQIDETLASSQLVLDRVDETAVSIDSSFNKGIEDFSRTMESVDRVAQDLDAVIVEEKATLDAVLVEARVRLEQLGDVLEGYDKENLQDLYSALDHLDNASRDLAILMEAMKDRPLHTIRKGVASENVDPESVKEEDE